MILLTNPYHGGLTGIVPEKVTGFLDCGDHRMVCAGGDSYLVKESCDEIARALEKWAEGKREPVPQAEAEGQGKAIVVKRVEVPKHHQEAMDRVLSHPNAWEAFQSLLPRRSRR